MTVNKMAEDLKAKLASDAKAQKAKEAKAKRALKPKQQKPKSIRSVAKARKLKPVLSETPTFGAIIPDSKITVQGGFVYKLSITHPRMQGFYRYYVGKKGWHTGSDWRRYQSSSDKVMALLQAGCIVGYEVISYHATDASLGQAEAVLIAKAWANPALRDLNLNFGIVMCGRKMSRAKYCKNVLKQVDKRF